MRLICNRTQNDAIWGLIALFLTNQIAGNTIDFKMNVIKLEIIIKETDFPTKNCRSATKITQLRQVLKSNGSATFVVEIYIYCTKRYFVKLYKRYYMFNLLLMHFSVLFSSNFMLKSAIMSYCFVSPDHRVLTYRGVS